MASNDKGLEEIQESTFPRRRLRAHRHRSGLPLPFSPPNTVYMLADQGVFVDQIESNYDEVTDSFDSMSLKAELLRGMLRLDYP